MVNFNPTTLIVTFNVSSIRAFNWQQRLSNYIKNWGQIYAVLKKQTHKDTDRKGKSKRMEEYICENAIPKKAGAPKLLSDKAGFGQMNIITSKQEH